MTKVFVYEGTSMQPSGAFDLDAAQEQIRLAVAAFEALVTVAKAADAEGCCEGLSCSSEHPTEAAVKMLDEKFPGWRRWNA